MKYVYMKKRVFACLMTAVLLIAFLPAPVGASAVSNDSGSTEADTEITWPSGPKKSSITAASAIVMDVDTGTILYQKKMDTKHYPASITKIMTTLLALENSSMDEIVTYSAEDVYGIERGSSNISIEVDEQLTMEQSLYGIMLESANEACLGVARHVGGTKEHFVEMMNEKAAELGCVNTHFANPNGLHDDEHYTTCHDMALIAQAAFQNETFRTITGTKAYTIPKTNKKKVVRDYIKNHHQMLNPYTYRQYYYPDCIGGKTGYTTKAESTLVTYARRNDMTLVCVVMKAKGPKQDRQHNEYTDTSLLLDYCFEHFKTVDLSAGLDTENDTTPFFSKYTELFDRTKSPIHLSSTNKVTLPADADTSLVARKISYTDNVSIQTGDNVIGSVSYTYGNQSVGSSEIIFTKSEGSSGITTALTESTKNTSSSQNKHHIPVPFMICITIAVLFVILLLYHFLFLSPRRKRAARHYAQRRSRALMQSKSLSDFDLNRKR